MAGADEGLPPIPDTPPTRRLGALSGNTKGIRTEGERDEQAQPAKATHVVGSTSTRQAPALPAVGELTSASEDAIVDPSEPVLEHIDLDSWKWPEYFAFALTRMEEIFPIGGIPRGIGSVREFVTEDNDFRPLPIDRVEWAAADEEWETVGDVLAGTFTDAWLVTRDGVALAEEYAWPMKPARQHMLFSVSKSIVSTVIGALADAGLLSPADLVTTHVPALAESGYAGATVRDLLDMRSGIKFSEEYLEEDSEIRALFEAVDFAPRRSDSAKGIKDFLTGLSSDGEHGGAFVYRSCETDVLAWVAEAVTGQPFSVVTSEYVWSKIGAAHAAQVCQDRWGGSIADGAISTTLRDLARFGEMIARGGTTAEGERVVSGAWIDDIFTGGPDSAEVFAESPSGQSYPGGMYRSQFWIPSADRNVVIGIGIHGQMLYIDRSTQTVGVKLSSDPEPVSLAAQHGTLAMFEAIAEAVTASRADETPVGCAPANDAPPSSSAPTHGSAVDGARAAAASTTAASAAAPATGAPLGSAPTVAAPAPIADPASAATPSLAAPHEAAPMSGGLPFMARERLY